MRLFVESLAFVYVYKNVASSHHISAVNLIVGWCLFACSMNFWTTVVFSESRFGPPVSKVPGSAPAKLLDVLHTSQIGFLANNRTAVESLCDRVFFQT